MANYFTSDHFKLLDEWQGQKRDETNLEQNLAYDELKKAYEVTERWAVEVKNQLFPNGEVKIRKRPTNQANNFFEYNWARIYPDKSSPKELAYTVGIDADNRFKVKIDTVQADPVLRTAYENVRGPFNDSPIVKCLPASDGLEMSLSDLVAWSINEIKNFKLSYDEVAQKLGLENTKLSHDLLKYFQGHKDFVNNQSTWGEGKTSLFCRIALAVHNANFDWWFTRTTNGQLRFGIKEKGMEKGKLIGWIFLLHGDLKISLHGLNGFASATKQSIDEEIVDRIEKLVSSIKNKKTELFGLTPNRQPYWPDDYEDDEASEENIDAEEPELPSSIAFNRIYYGPPGTGKTFKLLNLLKSNYTDNEVAPDSEMWLVEQIKTLGWFEVIALVLLDENKPLKVPDIVRHKFFQAKAVANDRTSNLTHTAWACLQRHTWSKSQTVELSLERRAAIAVFDKDAQSNWFVVDELKEQLNDLLPTIAKLNAGPKAGAIAKRYEFITFHQSYGYEEFVEGLRPELENDASDQVRYEIKHGPLRQLCDLARADKTGKSYALVIDEINRGNISKIFGELITLIEIDKREGSELAVPAKLPYSGDSFIIPPNVDFIGSMNTADRSLALVDTALRRRFEFVPVMPDPTVLNGLNILIDSSSIDVPKLLSTINERIEALYDRDHTIGHAYFTHIKKLEVDDQFPALIATFKNKIIPLLEEYFFEDWQKIRLVLGDNRKAKPYQFIQEVNREEDLIKLFGANDELDQYAVRARYRLNEESFALPKSYIGIYTQSGQSSSEE